MGIGLWLGKNIVFDSRYRKIIPCTGAEETTTGMEIISMDTDSLKKIIENKVKYKYLYEVFDTVSGTLKDGGRVDISGFGKSFSVKSLTPEAFL